MSASTEPRGREVGAGASRVLGVERERLFLVDTGTGELLLRAIGAPLEQRLATGIRYVLYDPSLELVWLSDRQHLEVIDLRGLATSLEPVLIATQLPEHVEIQVERDGAEFVSPDDACDLAPSLTLHWAEASWIEGGEGERFDELEGHAWLARERHRAARVLGEERRFDATAPKIALPPSRARCERPEVCGAALAFGAGPQLVLVEELEGADCWQFSCLLYDAARGAFATPPEPRGWGDAERTASGPCGPYRFDHRGDAFLVADRVCSVGGRCEALGGSAIGWLVPGRTIGAP